MQLNGVLGDTLLGQEVLNLDPLVTLELDDLASLLIFDEGTVASELLPDRTESVLEWASRALLGRTYLLESLEELPGIVFWMTKGNRDQISDGSWSGSNRCSPLGRPCKVVSVLRPFRCWIRMWM